MSIIIKNESIISNIFDIASIIVDEHTLVRAANQMFYVENICKHFMYPLMKITSFDLIWTARSLVQISKHE